MYGFETFSKRLQRSQRAGQPVIYTYDSLPEPFRVQVRHILVDTLGRYGYVAGEQYWRTETAALWDAIYGTALREFGLLSLVRGGSDWDNREECLWYLQNEKQVERILDLIDISFHVVVTRGREITPEQRSESNLIDPDTAINELNRRFREHDLGYQYVSGELIRADSEYLFAEVIEPALRLLHTWGFKGAESEFLAAHRHFRKGEHRIAIVEANNAFESTIKHICAYWDWPVEPTATASKLIAEILKRDLIPKYLQDSLNGLQNLLQGLPTLRNKSGGHGQSTSTVEVPEYMAAYALHLAGTNIVMLVDAHVACGALNF